jgi:hypothetical protein
MEIDENTVESIITNHDVYVIEYREIAWSYVVVSYYQRRIVQ